VAVEGETDLAVIETICESMGLRIRVPYVCDGVSNLRRRLPGFNDAARYSPWLVVTDLDNRECAAGYRRDLVPAPSPGMCLRIAVRETEAWVLAHREAVAAWLCVSQDLVPLAPDELPDPKQALITLARRSKRVLREDLVPRPGSGRLVGPAYASRLREFAHGDWKAEVARTCSPSLDRAMRALHTLTP
jgi:hypothetical protein